jgi:hypothetical protein
MFYIRFFSRCYVKIVTYSSGFSVQNFVRSSGFLHLVTCWPFLKSTFHYADSCRWHCVRVLNPLSTKCKYLPGQWAWFPREYCFYKIPMLRNKHSQLDTHFTFTFTFIRVQSLDMFRASRAHLQAALHKRSFGECCVRLWMWAVLRMRRETVNP